MNELCSGVLVMTAPQKDLNENIKQSGSAVANDEALGYIVVTDD